jgi:hypothetical protein
MTGETTASIFVDRREQAPTKNVAERRQFASSHQGLSPDARELALAIDGYKLEHHRRYITFEEMLQVIQQLGYHKD